MIHVCFMDIRILRSKNIQGKIFIVVDLKYIYATKSPRPMSQNSDTTTSVQNAVSNRPRVSASTCTHTGRCCLRMATPACTSTLTWQGITAAPGTSRRATSPISQGASSSRPTACWILSNRTGPTYSRPTRCVCVCACVPKAVKYISCLACSCTQIHDSVAHYP